MLLDVPIELFLEILLYLTKSQLHEILLTNKYCYEALQLQHFWKNWFHTNCHPIEYHGDWRELCLGFDRPWVCGEIGLGRGFDHKVPVHMFDHSCKQIASGSDFTLAIDKNQRIWSAGSNLYGQLGVGCSVDLDIVKTPKMIPDLKGINIAAGSHHAIFIDPEHRVWGCGENFYGQLGIGSRLKRCSPELIPKEDIEKAAAGLFHSLLLTTKGELWGSGHNLSGELGLGYPSLEYELVKIPQIPLLAHVSSRGSFSLICDKEGNLWATGSNRYGQLGLGSVKNEYTFRKIPNLQIKHLSAGMYHSLVIDVNDQVWVSGANSHGQLGLGIEAEYISKFHLVPQIKAKEVSAGGYHSLLIDQNDELWGCGSNIFNQLTLEGHEFRQWVKIPRLVSQHVSAGGSHTAFIGHVVDELY